jgi:hypothetical protein
LSQQYRGIIKGIKEHGVLSSPKKLVSNLAKLTSYVYRFFGINISGCTRHPKSSAYPSYSYDEENS